MRKIASIFIFFLGSYLVNAQINLDNTYAYSVSVSDVNDKDYFYYLMDVPESQCRIYNTQHELAKTINLSIPEGYYLTDIKFVGEGLFNTDDLLELLYIYEKYVSDATGNYYKYGLSVINEEGTSLLTLPNGGWADVKKVANKNKLLTYAYTYNPAGYYNVATNIYSLGGSATALKYSALEKSMAYPNPAIDYTIIETSQLYQLTDGTFDLYNAAGTNVLSAPIYKEQSFSIPTKLYPSGVYFYSIKSSNQLITTNKIIIK